MSSVFLSENGITITVIRTMNDWAKISDSWENIWRETPDASVFMSYPFLRSWWEKSGGLTKSLFILLIKDETNQVIGIAPLMLEWILVSGFPMRCLGLMYKSFHIDRPQFLLKSRENEQRRVIFNYLLSEARRWDMITFHEQLADQGYLSTLTSVFASERKYRKDFILDGIGPYLKIDPQRDSWDTYLKSRSKKHRKKWRYFMNRLSDQGFFEITRHGFCDDYGSRLSEYRQLENKSWKSTKRIKVPNWQVAIYQRIAQSLPPKGNLFIVFLRLNQRPIAGLIGLAYGNKYAALHTSYDKEYSLYSPGFLVGGYDMKWVIENGFTEYDFMLNYFTDKLQWTDTHRTTHMVRVIKKSAWAGLFNFVKFQINPLVEKIIKNNCLLKQYLEKKYPNPIESKFEKHNIAVGIKNVK